jgi:archaeal flagellar protein FlaJ
MASISSSRSLPRPTSKVSFREPSGFDLFYQLIYMSAVAAAGISRSRIFQLAAKLTRTPAEYFKRIHLLCEKLGYNYPSACTVVGQRTKSEAMKTLLLRFADALSSGHPEVAFLEEESEVQRDAYEKEYDRNLASLQKWTDAYAAIVVSAALIVIVNLTSTMIYDLGTSMVMGLVITAVLTSAGGAWIISRAAPAEPEAFFTPEGPSSQRLLLKLIKIVPPVGVIACALLALLKVDLGWILMVGSAIVFPLGIITMRATREIDKKDKEIGPFLRSFGAVAMSTGTTLSEALNQIDLASFPNLQPDMNRLRWRFRAAIDPELCWKKFALETGSKLISETITIFHDATRLGGDADTVGSLSSRFATTEVMLRARRKVIASTFSGLTIVMHAAIGGLMVIILEVIRNFTEIVEAAANFEGQETMTSMGLPMLSFGSPILQTLGTITIGMVILLALINGFAIVAADGGHLFKMLFHLPILIFLSGLCLVVVPPFVDMILKVG